jgi:hypothetical protein
LIEIRDGIVVVSEKVERDAAVLERIDEVWIVVERARKIPDRAIKVALTNLADSPVVIIYGTFLYVNVAVDQAGASRNAGIRISQGVSAQLMIAAGSLLIAAGRPSLSQRGRHQQQTQYQGEEAIWISAEGKHFCVPTTFFTFQIHLK